MACVFLSTQCSSPWTRLPSPPTGQTHALLRATFNVHDHAPPPPPAAPATFSDQQPLRPVVVSSSLGEDEMVGALQRMYLPFPGLSSFVDPFVTSILTWVARFRARHPIGESPMLAQSDTTLKPQGAGGDTSQGSRGNLSCSPILPSGQGQGSLPPIDCHSCPGR
ncbi:hypothetical protein LIER_15618 [Lithospermum erythrorhizon]|uniref:Uncharacterized protein n=1 Tax=Lithospermum erythrorhizon TaxID=34254 RepID=A0AAV3Q8W2_LITER